MISELNRKLRKMILIAGALLIILKLVGGMKDRNSRYDSEKNSKEVNGFQTEEFDDLW